MKEEKFIYESPVLEEADFGKFIAGGSADPNETPDGE